MLILSSKIQHQNTANSPGLIKIKFGRHSSLPTAICTSLAENLLVLPTYHNYSRCPAPRTFHTKLFFHCFWKQRSTKSSFPFFASMNLRQTIWLTTFLDRKPKAPLDSFKNLFRASRMIGSTPSCRRDVEPQIGPNKKKWCKDLPNKNPYKET